MRHGPPIELLFFQCPAEVGDVFGFDEFDMTVGKGDVAAEPVFIVAVDDNIVRSTGLIPAESAFKQQYQIARQLIGIRRNVLIHCITAWTVFVDWAKIYTSIIFFKVRFDGVTPTLTVRPNLIFFMEQMNTKA